MFRRWLRSEDGAVAVEFSILLPLLTLMMLGIISYGGCFWTSHALQELTNDAARSAIGGLSSAERFSLAQTTLTSEIQTYPNLDPAMASVSEAEGGQSMTVSVSYNASNNVFWAFRQIVPMPSSTIVRQATIPLGGY